MLHGAVDEQVFGGVQAASRFGYLGVNLFFMISGFVILWSSLHRSAGEFALSRIARLYPSFWLCVLMTTLVLNGTGAEHISLRTFALNLTMVPGVLGVPYVDGVYWTLFAELKFYVLVFAVLFTGTMKHVERWLFLWLACSVLGASGVAPSWLTSLAMYPLGSYFISGCVLYLIRANGLSVPRAVALTVSCVLAARYAILQQPLFMANVTAVSSWTVACLVVAFHIAFVAIACAPQILPSSRWWSWLGGLTYPLYLLHNRIGKTLWAHLPVSWSARTSVVVVLAVVYLVSSIIAAFVERRVCGAFQKALLRAAARVRILRASPA
jgi:peptidoglycan/LPS O-acetylase OafA/YrhL